MPTSPVTPNGCWEKPQARVARSKVKGLNWIEISGTHSRFGRHFLISVGPQIAPSCAERGFSLDSSEAQEFFSVTWHGLALMVREN